MWFEGGMPILLGRRVVFDLFVEKWLDRVGWLEVDAVANPI